MRCESGFWTSSRTRPARLAADERGGIILKLLGLVVLLLLAAVWVGGNGYAAHWIATHGTTTAEGPAPAGVTDVVYTANLHAWFAPPAAGPGGIKATIVVVHGYQADRSHHAAEAAALRSVGYGTLQIDLDYVGGKAKFGGGGRETDEVMAAVAYAKAHTNGGRVGLLGFSAGGTDAILAAARGADVVAVASDSAPEGLVRLATDRVKIPRWLFALTPTLYPRFSDSGHLVDLGDELHAITPPYHTPTLIIQGTADATVNPANGLAIATLTKGTLWKVNGAGHTASYATAPSEYLQRLQALFG